MGVIISKSNQEAILKYYKLLNTINLVLIPMVFLVWIFTPSLTKNLKSLPQLILRIFSIGFSVTGSGVILYSASELTKLKPKIDSLTKREYAEFKHGLASDLLDAQRTNEMIVESSLSQRKLELTSYEVSPEPLIYKELGSSEPGELQSYNPPNPANFPNSEPNSDVREYAFFDSVIEALDDEVFDSKIIKEIMGFKGINYARGKEIFAKIKEIYELEADA